MRYFSAALTAFLLLVPPIVALLGEAETGALEPSVVLVTGDFRHAQPFARSVRAGIGRAMPHVRQHADIEFVEVPIEPKADGTFDMRSAERQIMREIARHNVIGIISSDTSEGAFVVERTAQLFHIPALFAVATSPALFPKRAERWAFRLPASDRHQAQRIAAWMNTDLGQGRIAILHDTTVYGDGLKQLLLSLCPKLRCLTFQLGPNADTAAILQHSEAADIQRWVIAAYSEQARDFVSKKLALKIAGATLMSDGCYGDWLQETKLEGAVLSFPTPANASAHVQVHRPGPGYAPLGHDGALMFAYAIGRAKQDGGGRLQVKDILATGAAAKAMDNLLYFQYAFNATGENQRARFDLIDLNREWWSQQ